MVIAKSQILANKAADKVIVNVQQTRKPVLDLKAIVDSGDTSRIIKHAEKDATEEKSKFPNYYATKKKFPRKSTRHHF